MEQEQLAPNGYAIVARIERRNDPLKLRKLAAEVLDILNDVRPEESAKTEHNTLIFDVLHAQIRRLKQIEPDRVIRQ